MERPDMTKKNEAVNEAGYIRLELLYIVRIIHKISWERYLA